MSASISAQPHGHSDAQERAHRWRDERRSDLRHVPSTVARVVQLIRRDPVADDLTLARFAEEAGVGERALQYAFARHIGLTPMRFLREVRLAGAHEDLGRAEPGDGSTVSAIASRWRFAHAGRFAAEYRDAFGCTPSATLRTGAPCADGP